MSLPKLTLVRSYLKGNRTVGFFKEDSKIVTLERSWENNKVSVSCIPEGTYTVLRDTVGRFQYYRVENVVGRTFIELHGGVVPSHTEGCILIGTSHDSKFNLLGSDEGLVHLLQNYPKGFELTIRSYNADTDGVK